METPIAFIIYRRPELTAQVFERIREARPRQLFVIADGPRSEGDWLRCAQARRVVEKIDWPCEVQRNYSKHNQGCRDRVVSGLDWVFARVNEAIVVEDDCLPSPDFFRFCAELLGRYRDSDRVMHICGSNFLVERAMPYSYYFSRYGHVWGWATWARAWRHMDVNLRTWPAFKKSAIGELFADKDETKYWIEKLHPFSTGERADTWDHQW